MLHWDILVLCLLRHGVPSLSMQNRIPVNPDADLAAPSPISPSQTVMLVPLHHRAGSSTRTHASTLPSIGASARLPNHFPYPHVALRPSLMPVSAISLPIDVQLPVPRQQPTGIEPVPREVHVKLALLEDCMTSTSSNLELRNATAENPVFVPLARKHKPSSLHPKPTSTRTSPIFSNRISIFSEWQLNAETETRVCIGRQMAQSLLERLVMVADHFDRMTGRIKWIYEYSVASPLWEAICSAEGVLHGYRAKYVLITTFRPQRCNCHPAVNPPRFGFVQAGWPLVERSNHSHLSFSIRQPVCLPSYSLDPSPDHPRVPIFHRHSTSPSVLPLLGPLQGRYRGAQNSAWVPLLGAATFIQSSVSVVNIYSLGRLLRRLNNQ